MARTSLDDIYQYEDYLMGVDFDLLIPNLPGGGDARAVTIKCKTTQLPGTQLEAGTIDLHGFSIDRPGRRIYTKTLSVTMVETSDISSRDAVLKWIKSARGGKSMAGDGPRTYLTTGYIILYNDAGQEVRRIKLHKLWAKELQDGSLDGGASNILEVECVLNYDLPEDLAEGVF